MYYYCNFNFRRDERETAPHRIVINSRCGKHKTTIISHGTHFVEWTNHKVPTLKVLNIEKKI
jgi:hypothetical protein